MLIDITVIVLSAAVFLALILYLALEQKQREKLMGIAFFISAGGGIIMYGFGYSHGHDGILSHISGMLKTLVDVGRMYVGMNNEKVVSDALEMSGSTSNIWMVIFWIIHFLAYYSMASAAILTLGKGAIRKLQLILLNVRDVELIYGITDSSIILGRHLAANRRVSVVFVGEADSGQETAIRTMGAVLFSDETAIGPGDGFLNLLSIKPRKGRLRVYALSPDENSNHNYVLRLRDLLQKANIPTDHTSLVLLGREERHGAGLQADADHYGYGDVKTFDTSELTARLLMQKYPICNAINFDENCRATENVEVLLVGFGRMGQEVLKKLIANGQFAGSDFHAYVFDPMIEQIDGFFRARYEAMLKAYNVRFEPYSGESQQLCSFLLAHAKTLKYVVIATGNLLKGRGIADDILEMLIKNGNNLPVYQCCSGTVICHKMNDVNETSSLHDADILYDGDMDSNAKKINHYYNDPNGSIQEQWLKCDYFSRMSCRASTDFLTSLLHRLHADRRDLVSEGKLQNLGQTEHLRWNAFHYTMGYSPMSRETWNERAKEYQKQERAQVTNRIRISKDTANKQHACLVDWDELDELSERENKVTGKSLDYKQMDIDNVLVVIDILEDKN